MLKILDHVQKNDVTEIPYCGVTLKGHVGSQYPKGEIKSVNKRRKKMFVMVRCETIDDDFNLGFNFPSFSFFLHKNEIRLHGFIMLSIDDLIVL